jgi:uncharacterized protein
MIELKSKLKSLSVFEDFSIIDFRFINVGSLILKVTNKCNLDCKYCYEDISKNGTTMSIDTFKAIAQKAIYSSTKDTITFIFHGGEPSLISLDWFEEAVRYTNNIAELNDKKIKFRIQTNLISTTDEKLLSLSRLGIKLSASIDAENDQSNSQRNLSKKAFSNLERAKKLNIDISILSTINSSNYFSFNSFVKNLKENYNIVSFKANVAYSVGLGLNLVPLTPEQIYIAKKDILDSMIYYEGLGINEINLLKQINKYFKNSSDCTNELCDKKTCGAGKSVLGFNMDGDVLPCGRFTWNDSTFYLGNIFDNEIDEVRLQKTINQFQKLYSENWNNCNKCSAQKICNYGCQAFIVRTNAKNNIECESTKLIHNYFEKNINQIELIYKNNKRRLDNGYGDSGYGDYGDSGYADSTDDR